MTREEILDGIASVKFAMFLRSFPWYLISLADKAAAVLKAATGKQLCEVGDLPGDWSGESTAKNAGLVLEHLMRLYGELDAVAETYADTIALDALDETILRTCVEYGMNSDYEKFAAKYLEGGDE